MINGSSKAVVFLILSCWGGVLVPLYAQEMQRFSFEHPQMGTLFRLAFYANDDQFANKVSKECFDRLDELNSIFSDYDSESELSKLKFGRQQVSLELFEVLAKATAIAEQTNGAFDITIGHLSKLWRRAFRQMKFPKEDQIKKAKSKTNYQQITLITPDSIMLLSEGIKLDAGGIAKGYALDQLAAILRKHNINSFLIDGGGDILLGDRPPNQKGWKIEALYRLKQQSLSNCAIATSGATYRFLEWEGKQYSHLIDPRTGFGESHKRMVTVIAPTAMEADVLASAFSIIDQSELTAMKKKFPTANIQIIRQEQSRK